MIRSVAKLLPPGNIAHSFCVALPFGAGIQPERDDDERRAHDDPRVKHLVIDHRTHDDRTDGGEIDRLHGRYGTEMSDEIEKGDPFHNPQQTDRDQEDEARA